MNNAQPGILADNPEISRYLTFCIDDASSLKSCLEKLAVRADGDSVVVGFGKSLVDALEQKIDGLRLFPALSNQGIDVPSTPSALWCWLRGSDRGELFHLSREIELLLEPAFALTEAIDAFSYDQNRDLSGYEDGTENPEGEEAIAAAIVSASGDGLDGSSFVAVQQWLHDFDTWDAMDAVQQDDTIGRHHSDNEEFDEAPESAHVKRAAQESFSPEAFMLRHSMPWADGMDAGLVFIAFGCTFDAYEAVLNRMIGKEDGISDALFTFTRPISGAYYWCPPVKDGKLNLDAVGVSIK